MSSCIQVAVFYMVAAIGLFIDQLTLGPLRNLADCRTLYISSEVILLAVSSTTEGYRYYLIKFYSVDCTLDVFGWWNVFLFEIPAHFTCRAGQQVERRAKREVSCSCFAPCCSWLHGRLSLLVGSSAFSWCPGLPSV